MLYWVGLIVGIGLTILLGWMFILKKAKTRWYELLLGALGLLSAFVGIQHFYGSMLEYEITSAWLGILVFGILSLVMLSLSAQLIWRHNRSL